MKLPDPTLPWPIAREAIELICRAESCHLVSYLCPAGIWTCGWGETDGVTQRTRWTQAYADQRFVDSLTERADAVLAMCTVPPTDHQLGALVSLAYNIGNAALKGSSVLRSHNRGDTQAAARAFGLWNKARVNGVLKVLPGLTSRRAAEAALYLQPDDAAQPEPMPQAVAPESRLAASPIASSGAATAGVGALGLLTQVQDQAAPVVSAVNGFKAVATDTFGIQPGVAVAVVLVLIGAVICYQRWRQRQQGWA